MATGGEGPGGAYCNGPGRRRGPRIVRKEGQRCS